MCSVLTCGEWMTRVPAAVARVEDDSTDLCVTYLCYHSYFAQVMVSKCQLLWFYCLDELAFATFLRANHRLVLWQCTHCRNQHSTRVLLSLGTLFLRPRALYLARSTQLPWPQPVLL